MIASLLLAAALATVPYEHPGEEPVNPYEASNANAGAEPFADEKLFQAFHGQAGIDRIVDETVDRSVKDPRISEIFKATDLVRLRRTVKEQVCYLLAGPCEYTGRDMAASHKDQGLQVADFNAFVEHLQFAMDHEAVPFRAQNRLLAKLAPMKRDVVVR